MELLTGLFGNIESVFSYVLPFLFVLTVIVFFHELGHFMVARWCGVAIEVFSVGFGREIFGFTDRKGTRWKFSWIPLGGYVKFVGDENAASVPSREALSEMDEDAKSQSYYHKSVAQRSAVVAAGPIANFILAIVIFAALFVFVGRVALSPTVDVISPDSAAEQAGFQVNDVVVSIDGSSIETFSDMQNIVRTSAGVKLSVVVRRGEELVTLEATPKLGEVPSPLGPQEVGLLGITRNTPPDLTIEKYDPLTAMWMGTEKTWLVATGTLKFIGGLIAGREKASNLGGPLRIAEISGRVFKIGGFTDLIHLAAVLSVTIGLINLFPIPMLDGGHLLYYGIEAVRGRPLSEKLQDLGFRVGLGLVVALMTFVIWLDITHVSF